MAKPLKIDPYKYDLEFRSLIIALLKKRKGIGIDFFGLLQIDDMENGHVRVLDQRDWEMDITSGTEYVFKDVKEGVDFFMEIREERKLGYDFDRKRDRDLALEEIAKAKESKIKLIEESIAEEDDDDEDF